MQLNNSVKSAVISQLHSESEETGQKLMEEWINDAEPSGFKLEKLTAGLLIQVLEAEL